jgi:phosphate transport system protein
MSHFDERVEHDLTEIRSRISEVDELLARAISASVSALLTLNRELASETILRDQIVNRKVRQLDSMCHAFTAKYLPSGAHLRFVSSVLRISIALERIGDYASTICRESARMSQEPEGILRRDIDLLVREANRVLHDSVRAFVESNADMARGTASMASNVGKEFDRAFDDLVEESKRSERPIVDLFGVLMVLNRLSRICDQAKNICEETVFAANGAAKKPKRFRILFLDEDSAGWSVMATLLARRIFETRASVSFAGLAPASAVDAEMISWMADRGFDTNGIAPTAAEPLPEYLDHFHIVIDLTGWVRQRVKDIPYHVVLLTWPFATERPAEEFSLEEGFNRLKTRLKDLAGILIGDLNH